MALIQTPKSPSLLNIPENISGLKRSLINYSQKSNKHEDSNLEFNTYASRRSSRKIKKPNLFKITHERRPDPELQAALKRSKLDISTHTIDYSSITPVPVVYATKEEFNNPIKLWNKYSSLGEEYGAIKVVPPPGYTAKLPIDIEKFQFKVRQQKLNLLSNGNGFSYPSQLWNCQKMREYDQRLKQEIMGTQNPSLESVEKEYWNMISKSDHKVVSYYGADLNMFSKEENVNNDLQIKIDYNDKWNLYNLPKCNGSLLKYIKTTVPGVNLPWLYIGMIFSSFCWHTEDNYFGSVNYHHDGAPKIWYVVPPRKASKMESILKNYSSLQGEEFALYGLKVQIPPDILISNYITVNRVVQDKNEFVMVWPRTFHCGFNAGFNCNEACNIAPGNWIKMGYKSLINYKYARKSCIPFFRILLSSIPNLVDLESSHIDSIIECISLLIVEEYELRSGIGYPQYQMFIDNDLLEKLCDIRTFLSHVDKTDFDKDLFVSSMYRSETSNNYQFLVSCKEMADFCIKDCDLCDSPTFGSAILCNHVDTVVCISCFKFHECHCNAKVVLYRFPLLMFYKILELLKKVYLSMTGKEWEPKFNFKMPKLEQILKLDSQAYFRFNKYDHYKEIIDPETGESKIVVSMAFLEKLFEDISEACRKLKRGKCLSKRKKVNPSDNIQINSPDNVYKYFGEQNSFENLVYITKLTLKYTILALEEDRNESMP